ncbi:Transcriptional regulator, TetR family [Rhodococcus sp. AW25M09]|uniref:TetR/AcrR family transcriptional regulator n=1 Tax=Rhodococcus sp. AW25M09 TaxID=1268303 RepID=UPI0002AC0B3C|nr:TetR/AcrR family transcriptional regulator [Rhodococcus sp. AW25M09]CCQ17348.1 Transcriptional regulator, TetR family [Rhodococcus sp. AW25M09]
MDTTSDESDVPRITEGIFFTTPPKLPRGPHRLSREEVLTTHRERLMISFTELVAANGYSDAGVREIVERSSVSRSAFYDCFDSKESCAEAAYGRFISVLVDRMMSHLVHRSTQDVFRVLSTYFSALQSDLVVARAFQVEMDSAGSLTRVRRRTALRGVAELLHAELRRHAQDDPDLDPDLSIDALVGIVYAVRQLASDMLDTEVEPNLEAVVPRLAQWLDNSIHRSRPGGDTVH